MEVLITGSTVHVERSHVYRAVSLSTWDKLIREVFTFGHTNPYSADMNAGEWSCARLGREAVDLLSHNGSCEGPLGPYNAARMRALENYWLCGHKAMLYMILVAWDITDESEGSAALMTQAFAYHMPMFVYEVKSGRHWFHGIDGRMYSYAVDPTPGMPHDVWLIQEPAYEQEQEPHEHAYSHMENAFVNIPEHLHVGKIEVMGDITDMLSQADTTYLPSTYEGVDSLAEKQ